MVKGAVEGKVQRKSMGEALPTKKPKAMLQPLVGGFLAGNNLNMNWMAG